MGIYSKDAARALPDRIRKDIASMVRSMHKSAHKVFADESVKHRCWRIRTYHDTLIDGAYTAHSYYHYQVLGLGDSE